ncbi:DUF5367 domain-containing protein [Sphingobacterium yanglingense]|uniref:DUF5367 domain-containing protein n=1 Tax=Sphingobacterium yanglingense TaxID=1437280 RepID=A0A4R6WKD4_9SPHI|nr:DUF5367 domain-containing protein [Sphingobacterium yanglingense]TDQ79172.1 hypothetical protein CLV99_0604 [Sphingobacterium yanglingense]
MKTRKGNYLFVSFIVGFLVWLSATALFRIAGHHFFIVENVPVMVGLYILLIPALGFLSTWLFNKFKLGNLESIKSAVIMVLPGMLMDSLCIQFFEIVFPNMPGIYSKTFGAWLMFAYAVVLISGLLRKNKKESLI